MANRDMHPPHFPRVLWFQRVVLQSGVAPFDPAICELLPARGYSRVQSLVSRFLHCPSRDQLETLRRGEGIRTTTTRLLLTERQGSGRGRRLTMKTTLPNEKTPVDSESAMPVAWDLCAGVERRFEEHAGGRPRFQRRASATTATRYCCSTLWRQPPRTRFVNWQSVGKNGPG